MYTFIGLTQVSPEYSRASEEGDIIFEVIIRKRFQRQGNRCVGLKIR